MNLQRTIALILGLVFQLSQVLPAALVTMTCPPAAEACGCCTGPDSCPCAESGEPAQKPSPLPPDTGAVVKIPAAKSSETRVVIESALANPRSATTVASSPGSPPHGYAGVSASVAFCSFVI